MVRRALMTVVATCAVALVLPGAAPAAKRTPASALSSVVTLGDSFISGEAGRWQGNSIVSTTDRAGTDRAWTGTGYDPSRVYGTTAANGCHRSDVAEVEGVVAPVERRINVACSGAATVNIFRTSSGGQGEKGEATQAQMLRYVAQVEQREGRRALDRRQRPRVRRHHPRLRPGLRGEDRPVPHEPAGGRRRQAQRGLPGRGQGDRRGPRRHGRVRLPRSQYRFIVQSYGSPVPRASEARYGELDPQRASVGGCPFYDTDLNWARDSLVAQIADGLRFVAAGKGVEYLDLRNSLQGHEVCATAARQATLTEPAGRAPRASGPAS